MVPHATLNAPQKEGRPSQGFYKTPTSHTNIDCPNTLNLKREKIYAHSLGIISALEYDDYASNMFPITSVLCSHYN